MEDKFKLEKYTYTPQSKNSDAVPIWLCYPATYMIAMSSLGYLSLFRELDENSNALPEKIFTDTEKTQIPANEVKLAGFSFSFEFDFLGFLNTLEKYNIPLRSENRTDEPLIFGGGPVLTANPEPFADFFDFIIVGDGETILSQIIDVYKKAKSATRQEQLELIGKIDGIYVPSLYEVEYNTDNTIKSFSPKNSKTNNKITKICTEKFDNCIYSPIVTEKSFFPNTFLIELSRGCPKKCKFCLASYSNLPARYPDVNSVIEKIDLGLEITNKIGLLGALISEHPQFEEICDYLLKRRESKEFEVSVSSLRADIITPKIIQTLAQLGQRSTTIAVEAGSDRLRKYINKRLTENQIIECVKNASSNGLKGMKIYGIIGLPSETDEDIQELINLMKKLRADNKNFKLTLSVSSFVPKAHTPFQWEERQDFKVIKDKNDLLKKELAKLNIDFKPTSAKWDYWQGVLSRGDRRLSSLLEKVYKYGGSLGSWNRAYKELTEDEHLNIPDFDWYCQRKRESTEILPWDFIDTGLRKEILIKEACHK